ncbi:hypothetical protein BpHYR1_046219 [Brachionus plicatilis]|uniref:Uncharacterized protein n=1 Tax=Brachionus plicatilis TaxID=10195 RepID=A0A3M7SMN4_BRAPC|nr:hypothetical protein BpHYR1_046219 [Brachionus plicatilis]
MAFCFGNIRLQIKIILLKKKFMQHSKFFYILDLLEIFENVVLKTILTYTGAKEFSYFIFTMTHQFKLVFNDENNIKRFYFFIRKDIDSQFESKQELDAKNKEKN